MRAIVLLLAAALVSLALPASATGTCTSGPAAYPLVYGCVGDWSGPDGADCVDVARADRTGVVLAAVFVAVYAYGESYCTPRTTAHGIHVEAYAYLAGGSVQWFEYQDAQGTHCYMHVGAFTQRGAVGESLPCPLGPPPGMPWGHVLP